MLSHTVTYRPSKWSFSIENVNDNDSVDNDLTPLSTFEGISPFFVSPEEKLDGTPRQSSVAGTIASSELPIGYTQELATQSSLQQTYFPWSSTWRSFQQANLVRRASAGSSDGDRYQNGPASSSCNGERRDSYYQGSIGASDDGWDDLYEDTEHSYGMPPSLPLPSLPIVDGFSALSFAIENEFFSSCTSCSSEEAVDQYTKDEYDEGETRHDYDHMGRAEISTTHGVQDPLDEYAFRPHSDSFSSETSQLSFSRFEVDYAHFSQSIPITTMMAAASDHSESAQNDFGQDSVDDNDDEEEEEKDVQTPGLVCGIRYSHHRNQEPGCFFSHQSQKTDLLGAWKEGFTDVESDLEIEIVGEI